MAIQTCTMGRSRLSLGGGGLNSARKLAAVLVVLIMLIVPFTAISMMSFDSSSESVQKVTYKPGDGTGEEVTISYNGIASSEYNPTIQKMDGSNAWSGQNQSRSFTITYIVIIEGGSVAAPIDYQRDERQWAISFVHNDNISITKIDSSIDPEDSGNTNYHISNDDNTVLIDRDKTTKGWIPVATGATATISVSFTYEAEEVFCGWLGNDGITYAPGEILPADVTTLTAQWMYPDIFRKDGGSGYDFGHTLSRNGSNSVSLSLDFSDHRIFHDSLVNSNLRPNGDGESETNSNVYSYITLIEQDTADLSFDDTIHGGTYRSIDPNNPVTMKLDMKTVLQDDVIIDSVNLKRTSYGDPNHGVDNAGSLYANGHMLIIGTGVDSPGITNAKQAPQVFGGIDGRSELINGGWWDDDYYEYDSVNSTNVIIHSGVYYNVVAGSTSGTVNGDTNLIIRGGIVLDTIVGGNSLDERDGINHLSEHNPENWDATNVVTDNTNVWVLHDAYLPGDSYEEGSSGKIPNGITLEESTIITGGSNNGKVSGNTNVTISDGASVWDVQGGGRRGMSQVVGTATVTVSGDAIVRHVACGSITDGLSGKADEGSPSEDVAAVGATRINVEDSAKVGSVFGGGYDTYYISNYASMKGHSSTITVNITGGIVGYVYGGGYRGTVGTPDDPLGSVTVSISGGKVLNDVFGGGRGGLDKVVHKDGSIESSSMDDTTGYSLVFADNVSVIVSGDAVVEGNVYGGGESTPVTKFGGVGGVANDFDKKYKSDEVGVASVVADSVSVNVAGEAKVQGSIYGAGKGIDIREGTDGSKYVNDSTAYIYAMGTDGKLQKIDWYPGYSGVADTSVDYDSYASVVGTWNGTSYTAADISVSVESSAEDYTVGGDVYGGGAYGRLDADSVGVEVSGQDTEVRGSVYGGGLGVAHKLSTEFNERTITINGPTIGGSIYGGSRYGDDNCVVTRTSPTIKDTSLIGEYTKDYTIGNVTVNVVSGNILFGSSGNVYGGGYLGHSNYNVVVNIGKASGIDPISSQLRLNSVYGGSSVGSSEGTSNNAILLFGYAEVNIQCNSDNYSELWIMGDVFGEGDYCRSYRVADVTFIDFWQDRSMYSIQKAGTVRIIGSDIVLDGNVDGSTSEATSLLSLNMIGEFILQKSQDRASSVTMNAAASQISGYSSFEYNSRPGQNDQVGEVPDFDAGDVSLNTLTLNDGMIMSILGEGDRGTSDLNDIQGYTLLRSDIRGYYGAFAMGVTDHVQSDVTQFYVFTDLGMSLENGDKPVLADTAYYTFDGIGMTMWYLSGVYKVEETAVLQDDLSMAEISKNLEVQVPKTVKGSEIWFVGGYVSQSTLGSLNLVEDLTENPGSDFLVKAGTTKASGYISFDDNGVAAFPVDTAVAAMDGAFMGLSVSTLPGYNHTGYVGTVVMHMVEMLGNIPIGSFDVEIQIYLRIDADEREIEQTILMREGGSGYIGSTGVYLPVLSNNKTARYYIAYGEYEGDVWAPAQSADGLSLHTSKTALNKNGWISPEYPETGSSLSPISNKVEDYGNYLGIGGVFAPVLDFTYDVASFKNGDELVLTVFVIAEDAAEGTEPTRYTITLLPEMVQQVTVSVWDKNLSVSISDDDTQKLDWSQFFKLFDLRIDFGTSLAETYVALVESGFQSVDGTTVSFTEEFVGNLEEYIYLSDGAVHVEQSEDRMREYLIDTGISNDEITSDGSPGSYTILTVEEFLDRYTTIKVKTPYDDGINENAEFDYSAYDRWYDDSSCLSLLYFSSPVTDEVLNIYAGYNIKVTIVGFMVDGIDPSLTNVKTIDISPSEVFSGMPGKQIELGTLMSGLTWEPGYEVYNDGIDAWYTYNAVNGTYSKVETITPQADFTIYLRLQVAEYEIKVYTSVKGAEKTPLLAFTMTVGGDPVNKHVSGYGQTVVISFEDSTYHVNGATGSIPLGQIGEEYFTCYSKGFEQYVEFKMPNGDLELVISLTDEYMLTVTLPSSGSSDNGRFSIGSLTSDSDGNVTVSLTEDSQGLGSSKIEASEGTLTVNGGQTSDGHHYSIVLVSSDKQYEGSLEFGPLSGDIEVEIYVIIEWNLECGEGYTVDRYPIDPVTGELSNSKEDAGNTVHTGDVLVLVAEDGYTLGSVTYSGVEPYDQYNNGFKVLGTMDVTFTDASSKVVLSVSVVFLSKPSAGAVEPLVDADGAIISEVESSDGTFRFTVELPAETEYSVSVKADGYLFTESTGVAISNATVTIYGAALTNGSAIVEVSDGKAVIHTDAGSINGSYELPGSSGFKDGTFEFGSGTVAVSGGTLTLSGFDSFVGVMVLHSDAMGTLTIVSYPLTEGTV